MAFTVTLDNGYSEGFATASEARAYLHTVAGEGRTGTIDGPSYRVEQMTGAYIRENMRGVPDAGSARETLARVAAYTGIGDPATITEEDDGSITLSDGDRVVAVARPEVTS